MSKSRSLNKVLLIGNLTKDPILRESTSKNVLVCTFGIATNSSWKDSAGEANERAEFHNIVAFNKLAEICAQVLAKGMLVYLEGELRTRVKMDRDGRKIYKTEIKLNDMILLNSKERSGVGIDAAKDAGSKLMEQLGTGEVPEENLAQPAETTEAPHKEEEESDDSMDDSELF